MEGSPWKALVAVIALVQLTHGHYDLPSGTRFSFSTEYTSYDWPLLENETEVVYSRNVGPSRVFAWITHDPSKNYIVLQVVKTNRTSTFRNERCEFDFNVTDGTKIVVDGVRIWSDDRLFRATFDYHTGDGWKDKHVDSLDSITCHHAERHREIMKHRENAKQDEIDRLNKLKKEGATEATEADLAKLEVPKGYHFVDKHNDDNSTVRIGYVDTTSQAVSLAATIKVPSEVNLKAESLALERYGVCWQEDYLHIGGTNITCAQGDMKSKDGLTDLTTWATITQLNPAQWLGVHNYADNRMLVLVGACFGSGDCSYFVLYDVRPGRKVIQTTKYMSIGQCNNPADITVDAFYDAVRKTTCFNAVCVHGSTLKYRRMCGEEVPY